MSKLDFNDDSEKALVEQVFGNAMESLADEDRQLPQVHINADVEVDCRSAVRVSEYTRFVALFANRSVCPIWPETNGKCCRWRVLEDWRCVF